MISMRPVVSLLSCLALVCAPVAVQGQFDMMGSEHDLEIQAETSLLGSIWQLALEVNTLSEFRRAVELTELDTAFDSPGPITVFAPVDDAFVAVPQKLWRPEWKLHLTSFLLYHVVPLQRVNTANLAVGKSFPTSLPGDVLRVTGTEPQVILNGHAKFVTQNVQANNGMLHAIDSVLLPPFVATNAAQALLDDPQLSRFAQLLDEHGLLQDILTKEGPYTVLAPINQAFDNVPISAILDGLGPEERLHILQYHILPQALDTQALMVEGLQVNTLQGTQITITGGKLDGYATMDTPDLLVNNGILHLTDQVLIPFLQEDDAPQPEPMPDPTTMAPQATTGTQAPVSPPTPSPAPTPTPPPITGTISQIINSRYDMTILAQALNESSYYGIWDGDRKRTVFAPTDNALSSLVSTAFLNTTQWGNAHLWSFLKTHSLMGETTSSDLQDGDVLKSFDNSNLTVSVDNTTSQISINGVPIAQPDIDATNGVIHLLNEDALLPPWAASIAEIVQTSPELTQLAAAMDAADWTLLEGEGPLTFFAPTSLDDAASMTTSTPELLLSHLVEGIITRIAPGEEYTTLQGTTIVVTTPGTVAINATTMVYRTPQAQTVALMEPNAIDSRAALMAANGIVHQIDALLLPPQEYDDQDNGNNPMTPNNNNNTMPAAGPKVLEVIQENTDYSILAGLLSQAANVSTTLTEAGPYIVLVPNNAAMNGLSADILFRLENDNALVEETLLYHVVQAAWPDDLLPGSYYEWESLQSGLLAVNVDEAGAILVSDSSYNTVMVVAVNESGSNGVLLVIDGLLQPHLDPGV